MTSSAEAQVFDLQFEACFRFPRESALYRYIL